MTRDPISDALHERADAEYEAIALDEVAVDPTLRHRVQRRRTGVAAGSALASLVVASVVGVGIAQAFDGTQEPVDGVKVDDANVDDRGVISYVEVSMLGVDREDLNFAPPYECGAPAPEPGFAEDFTLETDVPSDWLLESPYSSSMNAPNVKSTVTYTGDSVLPVFVSSPHLVLVKDGVVIASTVADMGKFKAFEQSDSITFHGMFDAIIRGCEEESRARPIPAGEYEAFIVHRVFASEEEAARWDLSLQGLSLPNLDWGPYFAPGSYDCENPDKGDIAGQWLQCNPDVLPGASIDYAAMTATLPYKSELYARDLDVLLTSGPLNVTLEDIAADPDLPAWLGGDIEPPEGLPTCDTEGTWGDASRNVEATGNPMTLQELTEGTTIEMVVHPRESASREVTVELPHSVRVDFTTNWVDDSGDETVWGTRLAATAHATIGDGEPLVIDRYDGPARVTVSLSEVHWCERVDDQAMIDSAYVPGPITFTDDSGRTTHEGYMYWGFDELF